MSKRDVFFSKANFQVLSQVLLDHLGVEENELNSRLFQIMISTFDSENDLSLQELNKTCIRTCINSYREEPPGTPLLPPRPATDVVNDHEEDVMTKFHQTRVKREDDGSAQSFGEALRAFETEAEKLQKESENNAGGGGGGGGLDHFFTTDLSMMRRNTEDAVTRGGIPAENKIFHMPIPEESSNVLPFENPTSTQQTVIPLDHDPEEMELRAHFLDKNGEWVGTSAPDPLKMDAVLVDFVLLRSTHDNIVLTLGNADHILVRESSWSFPRLLFRSVSPFWIRWEAHDRMEIEVKDPWGRLLQVLSYAVVSSVTEDVEKGHLILETKEDVKKQGWLAGDYLAFGPSGSGQILEIRSSSVVGVVVVATGEEKIEEGTVLRNQSQEMLVGIKVRSRSDDLKMVPSLL